MKKILFIVCACVTMAFASCARCSNGASNGQDTVYIDTTVVVETIDTVYAD